jgi:hypothetical protein
MRGKRLGRWVIGAVREGQGVARSLRLKRDLTHLGLAVTSIPERKIHDLHPVLAGQILSARIRNARFLE